MHTKVKQTKLKYGKKLSAWFFFLEWLNFVQCVRSVGQILRVPLCINGSLHPQFYKLLKISLRVTVLSLSHSKDELRRPLHVVLLSEDFRRFSEIPRLFLSHERRVSAGPCEPQIHGSVAQQRVLCNPVQTGGTDLHLFLYGAHRLPGLVPDLRGQQWVQSDQNQREGAAAGRCDHSPKNEEEMQERMHSSVKGPPLTTSSLWTVTP